MSNDREQISSTLSGSVFRIDVNGVNDRRISKFLIFLKSTFVNSEIKLADDSIVINLESSDNFKDNLWSKNFFEDSKDILDCEIQVPDEISDSISHVEKSIIDFDNNYKLLKNIKLKNLNNNDDFKSYCDFCDKELACKLRPYQYKASYFLSKGHGGFDFSVPGSGKTIITYAAYNYLKSQNLVDSVLIIGPYNSSNAWQEEYATCFDKVPDFYNLAELSLDDVESYLLSSSGFHREINFINVDKVWRSAGSLLKFVHNKKILLVVDEAHKEKNPEAKITKAVLELSKYVNCRILLTGTPMPNGYEDLYTLTKIFSPFQDFLPFKYPTLKNLTKNGATEKQQRSIIESISPVYSRVSKKFLIENKELLPANHSFEICKMSEEQAEIYSFLDKYNFEISNDFDSRFNVALMRALLIRKMQISANPALLTNSIVNTIDELRYEYYEEFESDENNIEELIKADKIVMQVVEKSKYIKTINRFNDGFLHPAKNELAVNKAINLVKKGKKVIVWDVFVQNMELLRSLFKLNKVNNVSLINGSVTGEDRKNELKKFREGSSSVLIANPSTLAESISLHKCCQNAIYVNRNFNAAQFIQSKDRIHRINMPEETTASYLYLLNSASIDIKIDERLKIKEERMLRILDSDDLVIGDIENDGSNFVTKDDLFNVYFK